MSISVECRNTDKDNTSLRMVNQANFMESTCILTARSKKKRLRGEKQENGRKEKKMIYFGASDGIRKAFMRHAIHFTTQVRGSGEVCPDEKF